MGQSKKKNGAPSVRAGWLQKIKRHLPADAVSTAEEDLAAHAGDAWMARSLPEAVVWPADTKEVAAVMRLAHHHGIPVTTRGAGRGYVGGCVPSRGGLVLSLTRMNGILAVRPEDGVAVVQPGVITADLQAAAAAHGWFYPPDPASLNESSIGGNLATNAGGPRCLKYGVTRHYVLGLEVVLADGRITRLGGQTHKNKAGWDLVGLMVGSEGMLGVITEATLRLIPHPPARAGLVATFGRAEQAAAAVQDIFQGGFLPCALEVADALTLQAARRFTRNVPPGEAFVLVELDGQAQTVRGELALLAKRLQLHHPLKMFRAPNAQACEKLWEMRRAFSYSLKATGLKKLNEDIVVPRSRLVELFQWAQTAEKKYGVQVAAFGHAGDGNIHVNLMVEPESRDDRSRNLAALDDLFSTVVSWGGSITGEHGVGLAKKRWWKKLTDPGAIALHRAIKQAMDPQGILNPGKFL